MHPPTFRSTEPRRLHTTRATSARPAPLLRRHAVSLGTVLALVLAVAVGPLAWTSAVAITWFNPVCRGFVACDAASLGNAGYEKVYTTSFWGMYPGHNCTNYAAYRVIGKGVDASYLRGQGMAYQWGTVAASHGVPVDKSPRVGDIAWFDQAAGLSSSGHVAYVESVDLGAGTIRVSEDNYGGDFDWRSYYIRDVTGFIHFGATATQPPPPAPFADGDFLRVQETGQVYRLAGGAPLYVTSWTGFGGGQPYRNITAAQLAALPLTPRDGTFVKGTTGVPYRVVGGAPLLVSDWSGFGGVQPTITVDQVSIDRAGWSTPFGHLLATPRDGTFITSNADGRVYRIAGGAPLYVSTWAAFPGGRTSWGVDGWELTHYAHLRATPADSFIRGSQSQRVYHVTSGRAFYVSSWNAFGGVRPFTDVDDWAIAHCDHLTCEPMGALDTSSSVPGGVVLRGWAIDPTARAPLSISFVVDGVPRLTAPAAVSRPDVDAVYHAGSSVGFESVVPLPAGAHSVCAKAIGATSGTATSLGCGTATVMPGSVVPVAPTRLLDTRMGLGAPAAALAPSRTTSVRITGRAPVPASGTTAVLLNVTVTGPTASGYLTVYPSGRSRPGTSNLNFEAGQTTANLVLVPIDSTGSVTFFNGSSGNLQVITDVAGYVVGGSTSTPASVVPLGASRLLDTRMGVGVTRPGAAAAGSVTSLQVSGRGGVPTSSVGAVWLNVTVTAPTRDGYVTAYPAGQTRPATSNLNHNAGQTSTNLVLVPIDATGRVNLYNGSTGTTHLIADVAGYVVAGSAAASGAVVPVAPTRLLDTRIRLGGPGAFGAGSTTTVTLSSRPPLSAGPVSAVILNVTVASATSSGYLTLYPSGTARPTASVLNFVPGRAVPNLVVVPVGADGAVSFYNASSGSTQIVADVAGYIRR